MQLIIIKLFLILLQPFLVERGSGLVGQSEKSGLGRTIGGEYVEKDQVNNVVGRVYLLRPCKCGGVPFDTGTSTLGLRALPVLYMWPHMYTSKYTT